MKKNRVCGVTGMSLYSPQVQEMIEKEFKAIPMFLHQNDEDDLEWALKQCNFIVLAGGKDWSPTSTGGEMVAGEGLDTFDFLRDKRELFVMNWARENERKCLGICRGHQGIGLFHGLNLNLDINGSRVIHQPAAVGLKHEGNPIHFVRCLNEYKEEFFDETLCNSFHHQALPYFSNFNYLEKLGIEVIGLANLNYNKDKNKEERIIELMRSVDGTFLSSQWHIELDFDRNLASRTVVNKFKEMVGI